MNEELTFRQASLADTSRIMEIIRQAQAQMKALGSQQWQDGYPARSNIELDIAHGYGYVFEKYYGIDSRCVIAYGAVIFGIEPAYEVIDGNWLTSDSYVVLHRLAVAEDEKRKGIAAEFMQRIEALATKQNTGSLRVDTNFDNSYMMQLLKRSGFTFCGKIWYQSGERLAFEKPLHK